MRPGHLVERQQAEDDNHYNVYDSRYGSEVEPASWNPYIRYNRVERSLACLNNQSGDSRN